MISDANGVQGTPKKYANFVFIGLASNFNVDFSIFSEFSLAFCLKDRKLLNWPKFSDVTRYASRSAGLGTLYCICISSDVTNIHAVRCAKFNGLLLKNYCLLRYISCIFGLGMNYNITFTINLKWCDLSHSIKHRAALQCTITSKLCS